MVSHQLKWIGVYQVAEFVLCKSPYLLILYTQSPIKILGIYQVAESVLCKSAFPSILIQNHQLENLEFTNSWVCSMQS